MAKTFKQNLEAESTAKKMIKQAMEVEEPKQPVKEEKAAKVSETIAEGVADRERFVKRERLTGRMDFKTKPSTKKRLKAYCEANYISMNEYINYLIEEDLKKHNF